jgi:hypothetical protein
MDVCLLWVLCVFRLRSLRRTDHSFRRVLPTMARRCVWSSNLLREEAKRPIEGCKIILILFTLFIPVLNYDELYAVLIRCAETLFFIWKGSLPILSKSALRNQIYLYTFYEIFWHIYLISLSNLNLVPKNIMEFVLKIYLSTKWKQGRNKDFRIENNYEINYPAGFEIFKLLYVSILAFFLHLSC